MMQMMGFSMWSMTMLQPVTYPRAGLISWPT
jgi:hypothetical protein